MLPLLLVMAGGGLGAGARYLTGRAAFVAFGPGYPIGTLAVNLIGGFAMGLLAGSLARLAMPGANWRLLLGVGFLGGYTTFSSFSLELVTMLQRGEWVTGLGYALVSVIGSVVALFAGLLLVRAVT